MGLHLRTQKQNNGMRLLAFSSYFSVMVRKVLRGVSAASPDSQTKTFKKGHLRPGSRCLGQSLSSLPGVAIGAARRQIEQLTTRCAW